MKKLDALQYVPLLRWKRAERIALRHVQPNVRRWVTPIIELVPTVDNSVSKLTMDMKKSWPFARFYLDLINLDPIGLGNFLLQLDEAMRTQSLRPIPVTGLRRPSQYQAAAAHIAADRKIGLCIRLSPLDLVSSTLRNDLQQLLGSLRLAPEQIDLVADYQIFSEFSMPFAQLCGSLPLIREWRSFTILSGAFCEDLTEYKMPGQYTRRRDEWLFWQSEIESHLVRLPNFGDYSIQYGRYKEPPERANVSASIRYTAESYWVIMRGEGLLNDNSPGNMQYAAHAQLLCERDEYCGSGFSYGDRYIWELNTGIAGPGNPETLLRAGINHHVTLVANQLAKLVAASTGDERALAQQSSQQPRPSERKQERVSYIARTRPPQVR